MAERFQDRLALLDEGLRMFLKTLVHLGGYCTAEQAKRLGIAGSETRVLARLRSLERTGFLRRVAQYPVVYQTTGSATRLLEMDRRARRTHDAETVLNRLLAATFYLEARGWPAEFVFDHEVKVATLLDEGCPRDALPHRGGRPYLWEEFVLWLADGRIGITIVDRHDRSPFGQLWGFAKRFGRLVLSLGDRLELQVVTGSEARYRLYCRVARYRALQKLAPPGLRITIKLYQVQRSTKSLQLLRQPNHLELSNELEPTSDTIPRAL
jgi:hypothetical protein